MPRSITQYRVFIGSPGGLEEERRTFEKRLHRFSLHHAVAKGAMFHPVGWEDTLGGVGRPQDLINKDLEGCDYAVFVFHDRWGSPPGTGFSSGTEEEWTIAERLYIENKIRNMVLFFKCVDPNRVATPDAQLQGVLDFKKTIEIGKKSSIKHSTRSMIFRTCSRAIWARGCGCTRNR